jgi:PAS domain-containing protein
MHDRLEIAMSAANAGVYEIDLRSSERWTSPQYQELAGAEALARHAMRPFGMYHDDDIVAVRDSWERCLRSPGVESIDARLYRPNGRTSSGCVSSCACSAMNTAFRCALSA